MTTAGWSTTGGIPAKTYDALLLDLDGVVYVGQDAVPHAVEALTSCGLPLAYVTNNALRPPEAVAEHLVRIGLPARVEQVATSAQAAARVLAEKLEPGAAVLVCGGEGLTLALTAAGLNPVQKGDGVAAVVSGYDPTLDYPRLAEAALAVRAGAWWVAANTDATVPTPRGLQPGCGALVAMVAEAAGRRPDAVAGKPERALHAESVERVKAQRPLVVGDRLDTDVEGARNAGCDALLVLTGVARVEDLWAAPASRRPHLVSPDLRGVLAEHPVLALEAESATCRGASAVLADGTVTVTGDLGPDGLDGVRAAAALAWQAVDASNAVPEVVGYL